MAYVTKDGEGPFPSHAGEYCGNYRPGLPALRRPCQGKEEAERQHAAYLARMRFGATRPSEAFPTPEDGAAAGYVGLYLKEDSSALSPGSTEVPTPPELMEPGFEHLYNLCGVPGRREA